MLRCHVVFAVFKRNLLSYFTGVLGYLFIVVFVVAGAYLAFNARFFTNNLANLDELSRWFPMLLLFIVPAVTMSTWADERKLGTDELLFTLPAADVEILLGKYLAVLAVYTVTLLFSVTHLGVLAWYADPDWGLLFFHLLRILDRGGGPVECRDVRVGVDQQHDGCLRAGGRHLRHSHLHCKDCTGQRVLA